MSRSKYTYSFESICDEVAKAHNIRALQILEDDYWVEYSKKCDKAYDLWMGIYRNFKKKKRWKCR